MWRLEYTRFLVAVCSGGNKMFKNYEEKVHSKMMRKKSSRPIHTPMCGASVKYLLTILINYKINHLSYNNINNNDENNH